MFAVVCGGWRLGAWRASVLRTRPESRPGRARSCSPAPPPRRRRPSWAPAGAGWPRQPSACRTALSILSVCERARAVPVCLPPLSLSRCLSVSQSLRCARNCQVLCVFRCECMLLSAAAWRRTCLATHRCTRHRDLQPAMSGLRECNSAAAWLEPCLSDRTRFFILSSWRSAERSSASSSSSFEPAAPPTPMSRPSRRDSSSSSSSSKTACAPASKQVSCTSLSHWSGLVPSSAHGNCGRRGARRRRSSRCRSLPHRRR